MIPTSPGAVGAQPGPAPVLCSLGSAAAMKADDSPRPAAAAAPGVEGRAKDLSPSRDMDLAICSSMGQLH